MEFWKEVRRQVLTNELSQRAAMKKYGLGWHTLKKILAHAEPPGYRQTKARPKRKLEPFLAFIRQILEADRQAPKNYHSRSTVGPPQLSPVSRAAAPIWRMAVTGLLLSTQARATLYRGLCDLELIVARRLSARPFDP